MGPLHPDHARVLESLNHPKPKPKRLRDRRRKKIGHDPVSNSLEIEFANEAVYTYANVPAHEHIALINSHSIGQHFQKHFSARIPQRRTFPSQVK